MLKEKISNLEALQKDNVESVIKKIMLYINSHESAFSKDQALEQVLNLKIVSKVTNHEKASYCSAVLQSLKDKIHVPFDHFKRYLLILLGEKDQENVYERMPKVEKAFDRKRARGGLRGSHRGNALSRVRCYNCQAFGHFARDCKANTGCEAVGRSHKRRRTYDELNKE